MLPPLVALLRSLPIFACPGAAQDRPANLPAAISGPEAPGSLQQPPPSVDPPGSDARTEQSYAGGGPQAAPAEAPEPFIDLLGRRFAAPEGTAAGLLTREFVAWESTSQRDLLTGRLGVQRIERPALLLDHVFPRCRASLSSCN